MQMTRYLKSAGAVKILLLFVFSTCFSGTVLAQTISISEEEAARIAERVFANECFSKDDCLIEWNAGEEFLSLGIGHFIWYPEGPKGPFEESFLKYLSYTRNSGEKIPHWLDTVPFPACPWSSREDFLANQEDARLAELREFLLASKPRQAAFLIQRLEEALPLILHGLESEEAKQIRKKFYQVYSAPSGIYALVDYINFKGLGILATERYNGEGWGLLQVLSLMHETDSPAAARQEFVRAAKTILTRRVANSPPERNEQRWLSGWLTRLDSYLKE
jgi:hypothetical protein